MEDVINELKENLDYYQRLTMDYHALGHTDLMNTYVNLSKQYAAAISILEKAENNTGS